MSRANTTTAAGASDAPSAAVIVVNYRSNDLLARNLATVPPVTGVRIVVVDNRSDLAERERVRELAAAHDWELVEPPGNDGFGAGVNAGARRAEQLGCTGLILLNPDALLSADTLAALRDQLAAEPGVAVSPRIVTPLGDVEYRGSQVRLSDGRIRGLGPGVGDDGTPVRVDGQVPGQLRGPVQGWLTGACLALDLSLWHRVGGLREDYFLYWEDVDLSRRLESAGARLLVRQDLHVVHEQGSTHGTAGSRARSDTYYYFNCRNRLLFAAHELPRRALPRWIAATPRQSWLILMRGGRRQLLASPRPLWAAVRGSAAGVRIALRALLSPRRAKPAPGHRPAVLVAHPGAELYGSDRMLLETVDGLVSSGARVRVTLPGPGPLVDELERAGAAVTFCPMPVLRKSALRPAGFLRLVRDLAGGLPRAVRLVRRAGADGVYVSTLTIPSWLLLGRLLRRPVTCHVHEAERSAARPLRLALTVPVLAAHRIVVNSEYSKDVLTEVLPRLDARTRVVYNGVLGPPVASPARDTLDAPVRLLYVGRLSPRKGPDVALAAAGLLAGRGLDLRLELLGSTFPGYEWFERELRAAASGAPLAGRVEFLGFRPDVWPHLAGTDIVLVPSVVDEPFGNTAVEALLAARPVVVSATSGLREAAAGYRSAVQVPPGDAGALAGAIEAIVGNWPDRAAGAENDAVQAAQRHSPARYREQVVAAIDAARRSRSRP